jgi:hypothetical protein
MNGLANWWDSAKPHGHVGPGDFLELFGAIRRALTAWPLRPVPKATPVETNNGVKTHELPD